MFAALNWTSRDRSLRVNEIDKKKKKKKNEENSFIIDLNNSCSSKLIRRGSRAWLFSAGNELPIRFFRRRLSNYLKLRVHRSYGRIDFFRYFYSIFNEPKKSRVPSLPPSSNPSRLPSVRRGTSFRFDKPATCAEFD